jgi:hypothetical protein
VIVGSPQEKERMVADVSASRAIANGGEAEHGSGTFMAAEPSLSRVLSRVVVDAGLGMNGCSAPTDGATPATPS